MHVFAAGDKPGRAFQCVPGASLHMSSTLLNVIARALKRSNLAISDRLKPPYNSLDLPS
jgi:hypothetical protein